MAPTIDKLTKLKKDVEGILSLIDFAIRDAKQINSQGLTAQEVEEELKKWDLNTPVVEFLRNIRAPTRLTNCLHYNLEIKTMGDLLSTPDWKLLCIKSFGPKCLKELNTKLILLKLK